VKKKVGGQPPVLLQSPACSPSCLRCSVPAQLLALGPCVPVLPALQDCTGHPMPMSASCSSLCPPWCGPLPLLPPSHSHTATLPHARQALDFLMIAAHLTPKDISLWRRLAQLSSDQALIPQAIYCYTQARASLCCCASNLNGQSDHLEP
jgi:hypothetical protein